MWAAFAGMRGGLEREHGVRKQGRGSFRKTTEDTEKSATPLCSLCTLWLVSPPI